MTRKGWTRRGGCAVYIYIYIYVRVVYTHVQFLLKVVCHAAAWLQTCMYYMRWVVFGCMAEWSGGPLAFQPCTRLDSLTLFSNATGACNLNHLYVIPSFWGCLLQCASQTKSARPLPSLRTKAVAHMSHNQHLVQKKW